MAAHDHKYGRCARCNQGVVNVCTTPSGAVALRLCDGCTKRLVMWRGRVRKGWRVVELHGPGATKGA